MIAYIDEPADDAPGELYDSLRSWLARYADPRALETLARIAELGLGERQAMYLWRGLHGGLPECPQPAMALLNLERFLAAFPRPDAPFVTLRRGVRTLESILRFFGTSQYLSDTLIGDPSAFDWLIAGPERLDRLSLIDLLWNQLETQTDDTGVLATIRRFRLRQLLRIGYSDIARGVPLEIITQDLSHLADACLEGACRVARGRAAARHGEPRRSDGRPVRFVALALGKLGGEELNYSSDIDLVFVYEDEGKTSGPRPVSNAEFFARVGSEAIRLLAEHTPLGQAYRVDMRLRPEGHQGALARSLESTIGYYETSGRTWERQALIKCRAAAGDLTLGEEFIELITPFIYRRYLSAGEISEIKALKRQIEARTESAGADMLDVKTGHGGIRDVEFVVQFLQLLHGGSDPRVRTPNTLKALHALEQTGCVTSEERSVMEDTYRFLRTIEHRLQMVFDRQTHAMPAARDEQRVLARRLGYQTYSAWEQRAAVADHFLADYRSKTDRNRRILNHLLHDAFEDDADEQFDSLVNLVLDPDPDPQQIAEALGPYPFRDRARAYSNLMALAQEDIVFLSQARCRHFLAAIAPALMQAVAQTTDPDRALTNLERVSASLGAKAILWELFSVSQPSLRLYVELCASSQFLSEILVNNPGMVDDLIDSLTFNRPATAAAIYREVAELCRGAEDIGPILLGFRNKEWLRIGTRDILARGSVRGVTRELSDVAEAILRCAARHIWKRQRERVGTPRLSSGAPARWAILALGKLGGRELLYHGDLDLVFLYEGDGDVSGTKPPVANSRFFANVALQVIGIVGGVDGSPPLYQVDTRLRPHGSAGPLAIPLAEFADYLREHARPWELLALTRARVVHDVGGFGEEVRVGLRAALIEAARTVPWPSAVTQVRSARSQGRSPEDLKLGPGGMSDIEFLTQFLQLAQLGDRPPTIFGNTWDALASLRTAGVLNAREHRVLRLAYDHYRAIEARLQILHNLSGASLPTDPEALEQLARRVSHRVQTGAMLKTRLARYRQRVSDLLTQRLQEGPP